MDEKTIQVIENLSDKLGATASQLWPILVAHAKLEWVFGMAGTVVLLVCSLALLVFVHRNLRKDKEEHPVFDHDFLEIATFLCWVLLAIAVIAVVFQLSTISDFFYPEAAALSNLLNGPK